MTRQRRHTWEPPKEGKVKCSRCSIEVSVDEARRGIGPCQGKRAGKPQESSLERGAERPPVIELGKCGACDQPLKQVPFNSSQDMICCVNGRCELYRQRLRYVPALSTKERLKRLARA